MFSRRTPSHIVRLSRRPKRVAHRRVSRSLALPLMLSCLIIVAMLGMAGIFFIVWIAHDLPDPNTALATKDFSQSTKIFDRTGKVKLYELYQEEKRTVLPFEAIPQVVRQATLAAEDKDFYSHSGFDIRGIVRALYTDIVQGSFAQGGSTITQQLIKNTLLTKEKSFTRKLKELVLAYRIEQKFTKDQILKLYLNEIPYGANAYGVQAASEIYFGISADQVTLAQAALLASLPKAPSRLSPFGGNLEELLQRQRYILSVMAREGYISFDAAVAASEEKLIFRTRRDATMTPHFVAYIRQLLAQNYSETELQRGGFKVITTLDLGLQTFAEEAIAEWGARNEKDYKASNAGLVALDGYTGEIVAMVGSRDFFREDIDGQVNITLRPRQPGSSFKPMVYAAAFMKGYTPDTPVFDTTTIFKAYPEDYTPQNYDGKEHGPLPLKSALAGSLNIPAVKLLYLTGVDRVLDLADAMGYTTLKDRSRFGLSLVLGGAEVKLLEHAAAFRAFAENGIYRAPSAILKILDSEGVPVFSASAGEGRLVVSPEVARTITSILSDNGLRTFIFGAQSFLQLPDRPAAVKTGTTNDFHDAWTLGAVPSLTAGVWVGNNDNSPMKKGADGSKIAAPIWQSFMKKALAGKPVEAFVPPIPSGATKPILQGQGLGEVTVVIDKASGKRATSLTPDSFKIEKKFKVLHDILHFVNKDDPKGPEPFHPAVDPQYAGFEAGVSAWAAKQGLQNEEPPQGEDDVHVVANIPTVTLSEPTQGSRVASSVLLRASATAPRGIAHMEVFLNDTKVASENASSFQTTLDLNLIPPGFHIITVVAYDDIDNKGQAQVTVNVVK